MVNFLVWIVMGAVVGAVAGMLTASPGRYGLLTNIVVGILGAAVGGAVFRSLGASGANINDSFSLYALMVSVIGALIVIGVTQLLRKAWN